MVHGLPYIVVDNVSGPPEKDKFFHKIEEDGIPIHHNIQKSSRKSYMNEFENWEKAKVCIYKSFVGWKTLSYATALLSDCV